MNVPLIKLQIELHKVNAALLETKVRIVEREEEVKKIQEVLEIQTKREAELAKQIEDLKKSEGSK